MEDTKTSFDSKQNPLGCTQQIYSDFFWIDGILLHLEQGQSCKILKMWQMTKLIIGKHNNFWPKNHSNRGKFHLKYKQQHLNDNKIINVNHHQYS